MACTSLPQGFRSHVHSFSVASCILPCWPQSPLCSLGLSELLLGPFLLCLPALFPENCFLCSLTSAAFSSSCPAKPQPDHSVLPVLCLQPHGGTSGDTSCAPGARSSPGRGGPVSHSWLTLSASFPGVLDLLRTCLSCLRLVRTLALSFVLFLACQTQEWQVSLRPLWVTSASPLPASLTLTFHFWLWGLPFPFYKYSHES